MMHEVKLFLIPHEWDVVLVGLVPVVNRRLSLETAVNKNLLRALDDVVYLSGNLCEFSRFCWIKILKVIFGRLSTNTGARLVINIRKPGIDLRNSIITLFGMAVVQILL